MTPSGRLIVSDRGVRIDDNDVLTVEGLELDEPGQFAAIYTATCDVCEGYGHRHGRRCEWCVPSDQGEYVTQPQAMLPLVDLLVLRAWALRQQFAPTAPGHDRMAEQVLAGCRYMDAQVAREHAATDASIVDEQTREVA